MKKFLLIFLFFCAFLSAKEEEPPYLTSESDTLALVEGVVNAYNGKLVQPVKQIFEQQFKTTEKGITKQIFVNEGMEYIPKCSASGKLLPLPRNQNGVNIPSVQTPHTQLGIRNGSKNQYRQTREWSYNGKEIKTTDWTNHGRPDLHSYPHDHYHTSNATGGTLERGKAVPFRWPDE